MDQELRLSDEWDLITKVKEGRRSSFDTLVSLYQHRGLSIVYTMVGNVEDAQDVLQEAFVKVYAGITAVQITVIASETKQSPRRDCFGTSCLAMTF